MLTAVQFRILCLPSPKTEEVAGGWRRLRNEQQLHNLYYSPYVIKENEIGCACIAYGRYEKCIQIFRRKTEGKRSRGSLGGR